METQLTVAIITALGAILAAMWGMFKNLQSTFLKHLENSDMRMIELVTTKNGHLERIANEFNKTVREFQAVLSKQTEQIDSIDKRV